MCWNGTVVNPVTGPYVCAPAQNAVYIPGRGIDKPSDVVRRGRALAAPVNVKPYPVNRVGVVAMRNLKLELKSLGECVPELVCPNRYRTAGDEVLWTRSGCSGTKRTHRYPDIVPQRSHVDEVSSRYDRGVEIGQQVVSGSVLNPEVFPRVRCRRLSPQTVDVVRVGFHPYSGTKLRTGVRVSCTIQLSRLNSERCQRNKK